MNILNTYNEFDTNNFDLNVDHYGAEVCDKNYAFGPSVRENFVLHFIVDGKGKFTINGKTTDLKAGDIFILPKNQLTYYQADKDTPWSYIWVGFSGSKADLILNKTSLLSDYCCHSNLDSKILDQMFKITQFRDAKMSDITELRLMAELYKLFSYLIEEFPNPSSNDSNVQVESYVKQALKIIHNQYDTPLRVGDIAQKLNLNRSYFYKIFKEYTGYSIKDYILKIKMEKSADLLLNPEFSIFEVSNSVGFSDSLAFSKSFKKYFKLSPSDYRLKHNNN